VHDAQHAVAQLPLPVERDEQVVHDAVACQQTGRSRLRGGRPLGFSAKGDDGLKGPQQGQDVLVGRCLVQQVPLLFG
jgi:hypothetical protein